MPIYIYKAKDNGDEFEYKQSINDESLKFWPQDIPGFDPNNPREIFRKINSAGVILKGSGFYQTDYVKKTGSPEKSETKAD